MEESHKNNEEHIKITRQELVDLVQKAGEDVARLVSADYEKRISYSNSSTSDDVYLYIENALGYLANRLDKLGSCIYRLSSKLGYVSKLDAEKKAHPHILKKEKDALMSPVVHDILVLADGVEQLVLEVDDITNALAIKEIGTDKERTNLK
jgi:hypothetical protein